jgi:hypothetical protein
MSRNSIQAKPEAASTAGKSLKQSDSKVLKKLAASTLVNAKKDTKPKKK